MRSTLFVEIQVQVAAFKQLHDDVAVVVLVHWIKCPHEVLVADDVRVAQVLGDGELGVQLVSLDYGEVYVVVDPIGLVHKVSGDV